MATVHPGNPADPWPTELLAQGSESSLQSVLRTVLSSGQPTALQALLTRDATGEFPAEDGGGATDRESVTGPSAIAERVAALLRESAKSDGLLTVEVLASSAPAIGEANAGPGRTTAHVRIGPVPEASDPARYQVDWTLELEWRLARRVKLRSLRLVEASVQSAVAPFRDTTLDVLRMPRLREVLGLGALEAAGRTDRVAPVSDVTLGMHGIALGDLDGDGLEDMVVGRAAGQPNLVFMNRAGEMREEGAARGLDFLDDTGGMLIVDLDGDGARDVAMGRGGDVVVAWNDGTGHFTERSGLPGAGPDRVYSLAAADIDRDGDLDLYDTRYFQSGGYGVQAPTPYHDATNGAPNVFWRNLLVAPDGAGARRFRDDTAALGLDVGNDRFSLSAAFDDLDGDGDLDLYVTNDFGRNNLYLWEGTAFREASEEAGLVDKAAGMGVSFADVDLDGLTDVVVSNMHSAAGMRVAREAGFQKGASPEVRAEFQRHARGNTLYRGLGGGSFEDVSDSASASPGGWAWGARFVDWNRDGLADIVVPNGFLSGRKGPDLASFFWRRVVGTSPLSLDAPPAAIDHYLAGWSAISHLSQFERQDWNARERTFGYRNMGDFRFRDESLSSGLGFADDGRALVAGDLDGDGRVDLVFRNRTSPILRVLQGTVEEGHWVSLRLENSGVNMDAVGALVRVVAGGTPRTGRLRAGDGFLGGSSLEQHFGLGDLTALDGIDIQWPDGTVESLVLPTEFTVDARWLVRRGSPSKMVRVPDGRPAPGLAEAVEPSLPSGAPGPMARRVPLFTGLPFGAWRVPLFGGPPARLDELVGDAGALVVVSAAAVPGSGAAQETLARIRADLDAFGLPAFSISLDGVREERAAKDRADALGIIDRSGRADRPTRMLLELILSRTLAPFDDVPLPLGMLFDGRGDLVCLYVGSVVDGELIEDARRLAEAEPEQATLALLRGRWIDEAPARSLGDVPAKLAERGLDELGEHIRSRISPR